jgi:hypothetical protein
MRLSTLARINTKTIAAHKNLKKSKEALRAVTILSLLNYYKDSPSKERLKVLEAYIDQTSS